MISILMVKNGNLKIEFCKSAVWAHKIVEEFEAAFAKRIGVKYCVAVNSGYTALFLALKALGIGKGDEVLVPNFTMIATANAVKECGAKPVFLDADYTNGNIKISDIEGKITKHTKAIIPVHIYGHPVDMDSVNRVARKHDLIVIEDAAEAHGATYKGKQAGNLGQAGCFSFYSNKIISTGEGGAITTNDYEMAKRIRALRSYCFDKGYWHSGLGYSFRLNPYGAKHGLRQLKQWDKLINRRREIAKFYNKNLTQKVIKPVELKTVQNVYWMYGIRTLQALKLKKYLAKRGVATRDFFIPMSLQKVYNKKKVVKTDRASELLSLMGVLLPSMPELTKKELQYTVDSINKFFGG